VHVEDVLDEMTAGTFPASDPPQLDGNGGRGRPGTPARATAGAALERHRPPLHRGH
jgi:hypothetical protein